MKVTTFSKLGATAIASALIVGALSTPALADPPSGTFGTLVGLGSDTTQDVMNGVAAAIGADGTTGRQLIASYLAVGSDTVVTREGGAAIVRANGSGAGRDLLRVAIGQTSPLTIAKPTPTGISTSTLVAKGNIDFARSSSGLPGTSDPNGVLTYIPYAKDVLDVAFQANSPLAKIPTLRLGNGSFATTPSDPTLYNIYRGTVKYVYLNTDAGETYNSVGDQPTGPANTTAYLIKPLIPQSGSGTRNYFRDQLGLTDGTLNPLITAGTVKDTWNNGGTTVPVQEHDGAALAADPMAIAPFSVPQWVAQANQIEGVTDRRNGAVLAKLVATPAAVTDPLGPQQEPVTGSGTSYATNSGFTTMNRNMFTIVPSKLADDETSKIYEAFVGPTSKVCLATATISAYGFLPLTGSGTNQCGNTDQRFYAPSSSSVSFTLGATSVNAGGSVTANATVTSTGDGGGTVKFTTGTTVLGEATIADGSTTGTASLSFGAGLVGTQPVKATFLPRLAGVNFSEAPATQDVTVALAQTETRLSAPATSTIGRTIGAIVWVDDADSAGGTVQVFNGTTPIGSPVALGAGEFGVYVPFTAVLREYNLTAKYTPPAGSLVAESTTAGARNIQVAKATPTITIPTSAKSSKGYATITIKVAASGAPTATGTVTIKDGSKTVVSAKALSAGTYKVKLKKGTHKISVTYAGNDLLNTATRTNVTVKIS